AVGGLFFPIIRPFFIPIVLAATFAGLLRPIYKWLYTHLWHNRFVASFLSCLFLVLVVLIPAYIIIQLVIDQMINFYQTAQPWMNEFSATWRDNEIVKWFLGTQIGQWLVNDVDWVAIRELLARNLTSYATVVVNATYTSIFGLIFDLFIMLFVLFYFLIDGKRILERAGYLLPLKQQYQQMAYTRFILISQATIKGTFIIGLVDGILGGLTLLIFGIDSWLFWGFIIAIFSILPLVGPSFVLVPAAIIQIIIGDIWQGIGILIVSYTIVLNADNVIRPLVVGSSAKMHELLVFFSTIGGLSVFGITGFIIGPIVASLLLTLLDIYAKEFRPQLNTIKRNDIDSHLSKTES
ncbi:MAG: AI-2E family transporter, partial [Fibrobacter sp.]|nr:AI-2E family transporter [Fibrobacter sp.]